MSKINELALTTGNEPIIPKQDDYNEQYEDTPIWIRGNKEIGYFATLADFRITECNTDIETLENKIRNWDWEILLNTITTIVKMTIELEIKNIKK